MTQEKQASELNQSNFTPFGMMALGRDQTKVSPPQSSTLFKQGLVNQQKARFMQLVELSKDAEHFDSQKPLVN
jgi:hypothetical protein